MAQSLKDKLAQLEAKIKKEAERAVGKGLLAAGYFLQARVKETMSVAAPRKKTASGEYRATTPAQKDAPIRKLSGRARAGMTVQQISERQVVLGNNAKSKGGYSYPKHHELDDPAHPSGGKHKFVRPTVKKYKPELINIVGGKAQLWQR